MPDSLIMKRNRLAGVWLLFGLLGAGVVMPALASEPPAPPTANTRMSEAKAREIVLAKMPGWKLDSGRLEKEHGRMVWEFDAPTGGEIQVDAVTGEIIAGLPETPAGEVTAEGATKLQALRVEGGPVPGESEFVGTYHQPEWTARRPFAFTSVYVLPAEQAEMEMAFDSSSYGSSLGQFYQEVEVGLPQRFQLSLENYYQNFREDQRRRSGWRENNLAVGIRYALGDWGAIPLNPAVGVAWKSISGAPDAAEYHVVIGGELTPRWHWAADAAYEKQWGGPRFRETTISGGLTYTVKNERLNVGVAMRSRRSKETNETTRKEFTYGPCFEIRPSDLVHINLSPMWGAGKNSPAREFVLSVGFDFGEGSNDHDDHPKSAK